jgi:hypothetical protein
MDQIEKLVKTGKCSKEFAVLILWEKLPPEKREILTFEQRQWVWENTPAGTPEEAEAWELVKAKAETLEQCQWVWEKTPAGTPEKAEALALVKAKAETLLSQ